MEFEVTVEAPQGSRNGYEMDHALRRLRLSRLLAASMRYPVGHGYIEGTLGHDGTPLTALVLSGGPAFPGCSLRCRTVGMYVVADGDGLHERVLCVPARDPRHVRMRDVDDMPSGDQLEIARFYGELTHSRGKQTSHWAGRDQAEAEIEASRLRATADVPT